MREKYEEKLEKNAKALLNRFDVLVDSIIEFKNDINDEAKAEKFIRDLFPSREILEAAAKIKKEELTADAENKFKSVMEDYDTWAEKLKAAYVRRNASTVVDKMEDVRPSEVEPNVRPAYDSPKVTTIAEQEDIPTNAEKVYVKWDRLQDAINGLEMPEDYDTILCITRGGLIPAGLMAYKLGIKDIVNIKISSYDDNDNQGSLAIEKLSKKDIKKLRKANKILIVDDIVDTGDTLDALLNYLYDDLKIDIVEDVSTFTIVTKDANYNDYYLSNMEEDDSWVVFPWDT